MLICSRAGIFHNPIIYKRAESRSFHQQSRPVGFCCSRLRHPEFGDKVRQKYFCWRSFSHRFADSEFGKLLPYGQCNMMRRRRQCYFHLSHRCCAIKRHSARSSYSLKAFCLRGQQWNVSKSNKKARVRKVLFINIADCGRQGCLLVQKHKCHLILSVVLRGRQGMS